MKYFTSVRYTIQYYMYDAYHVILCYTMPYRANFTVLCGLLQGLFSWCSGISVRPRLCDLSQRFFVSWGGFLLSSKAMCFFRNSSFRPIGRLPLSKTLTEGLCCKASLRPPPRVSLASKALCVFVMPLCAPPRLPMSAKAMRSVFNSLIVLFRGFPRRPRLCQFL